MLSTDTFPTRIGKDSISATDNIIDRSKFDNYKTFLLNNGLSDHDPQLITINISLNQSQDHQTYFKRKTNKCTIANFLFQFIY